ncbi:Glutathione S-transferase 2 [Microbotryomycetes sp. JL221]|nr:Glutathione S-transferase 2 [Microbotryomycetes sp. JL221]
MSSEIRDVLNTSGLVLIAGGSPNSMKVSTYLEELKAIGAIPGYAFYGVSFSKHEQKEPWFLEINPNGRIPALVDNREGKKPINVWESASILLYLAKTYDTNYEFHFKDEDLHTEMLNWLFFLQGGLGPIQGQANHFFRYAPEKIQYGIDRYQNETRRLYSTYEKHFEKGNEWLVGGKCSIADFCTQPWVRMHAWCGVDSIEEFPRLKAWMEKIEARPAFQAGLQVPEPDVLRTLRTATKEEMDKMAQGSMKWIQEGMKQNAA